MKKYLVTDEWSIIEEGFSAERLRMSESIFSIGNGRFGERGNFEEPYSSDSYRGSFVAGTAYLDKTLVGWWKNGYPKYYIRLPKAANWSRIDLRLIDESLDMAQWNVDSYRRELDMKHGISRREMEVTSPRGNCLHIHVEHVDSIDNPDLCIIRYRVRSINYNGRISLLPLLDGLAGEDNEHEEEYGEPSVREVEDAEIHRCPTESAVGNLLFEERLERRHDVRNEVSAHHGERYQREGGPTSRFRFTEFVLNCFYHLIFIVCFGLDSWVCCGVLFEEVYSSPA